jgi:hypothetical protein
MTKVSKTKMGVMSGKSEGRKEGEKKGGWAGGMTKSEGKKNKITSCGALDNFFADNFENRFDVNEIKKFARLSLICVEQILPTVRP